MEEAIEACAWKETPAQTRRAGKASRIVDAAGRYIEFCKGTFPNELSPQIRLKVVVIAPTARHLPYRTEMLARVGATVIAIGRGFANGVNINEEVGD